MHIIERERERGFCHVNTQFILPTFIRALWPPPMIGKLPPLSPAALAGPALARASQKWAEPVLRLHSPEQLEQPHLFEEVVVDDPGAVISLAEEHRFRLELIVRGEHPDGFSGSVRSFDRPANYPAVPVLVVHQALELADSS